MSKLIVVDVENKYSSHKTLISNMKNNDIKRVIKTIFGQFIPLNDKDVVL